MASSPRRCLSPKKIGVASTRTPCARARAMAAKAPSNSAALRAPTGCNSNRSLRAGSSSALSPGAADGVPGCQRTAIRVTVGTTDRRISSPLAPNQVRGEFWDPGGVALGLSDLDQNVLALDPAALPQTQPEPLPLTTFRRVRG